MGAELAGCVGEQPRPADVGHESDARLRHPEPRALRHEADPAVRRDADAAAEHESVHDGDVGLGIAGDQGVERVLVGPEGGGGPVGGILAGCPGVPVDAHDVPTGAQAAVAAAREKNGVDGLIRLPGDQRPGDGADHAVGECVDGARAVELDVGEPAAAVQQDLGLGGCRRGGGEEGQIGPFTDLARPEIPATLPLPSSPTEPGEAKPAWSRGRGRRFRVRRNPGRSRPRQRPRRCTMASTARTRDPPSTTRSSAEPRGRRDTLSGGGTVSMPPALMDC